MKRVYNGFLNRFYKSSDYKEFGDTVDSRNGYARWLLEHEKISQIDYEGVLHMSNNEEREAEIDNLIHQVNTARLKQYL